MMNKKIIKIILPFIVIAVVLLLISIINTRISIVVKDLKEDKYENLVREKIANNDISNLDYNYLNNDLNEVDSLLNDIINTDIALNKKSEYYSIAEKVYENKINELTAILNQKLDDEDFENLQNNLDEFYKNLEFAVDEIKKTNKSTVDAAYNSYKYLYEEKQRKCRDILEEYKGFLIINK